MHGTTAPASPQTARSGMRPDAFHEPPYPLHASDSSLSSRSARDARVTREPSVALGVYEGTVLPKDLASDDGAPAVPELGRLHDQGAGFAVHSPLTRGEALRHVVHESDVDRACRREVAGLDGVRALARGDRGHELGDEEVEVRVPLPVGVAHFVERDSVDGKRNIRPVRCVETTQEELLRVASPGVLHLEEPRHGFDDVLRAVLRAHVELLLAHGGLGRRRLLRLTANQDLGRGVLRARQALSYPEAQQSGQEGEKLRIRNDPGEAVHRARG